MVDVRRGFGPSDELMLHYASSCGLPAHVLLAQSDKLGRREAREVLQAARNALGERARVQLFAAVSGEGVDAAQGALEALLAGRF